MIQDLEQEYKVPSTWRDGPVQNEYRTTTDCLCLLLFLLYTTLLIVSAIGAFSKSSHNDITKLYDSSDNACGFGDAKDYPFLYMQNFSSPYKSVCVKKCPQFDYNEIMTGSKDSPMYYAEFKKQAGLSHTHNKQFDVEEAFTYDEGFANGKFTKQQYDDYVKNYKLECLPNKQFANCTHQEGTFYVYDSYDLLGASCVPLSPKAALRFNKIGMKINHGLVGDLMESWYLFIFCSIFALVLGLVFLILMCCAGGCVAWLLLLGLVATLLLFGVLIFINVYHTGPLNNSINALRVKYLSFMMKYKSQLVVLAVFFIIAGLLFLIFICKYNKQIRLAIPILALSSKSSLKNILLIFLSIFIITLQISWFFLEIYVMLRIYTSGKEIHNEKDGNPFVHYEMTDWNKFLIVFHCFGMYWVIITLNNFNDFVCAAVTVNYYF